MQQGNKKREKADRLANVKPPICADDTIVYVEKPKEYRDYENEHVY